MNHRQFDMANIDSELSTNIEFLHNYLPIKRQLCDNLTDFEYQLICTLTKTQNKSLLFKLLKPVRIEPQLKCWFRAEDWSCYSTLGGERAHRISYEFFIGKVVQEICHHCDRKGCINPWHLFQGTHSENMKDAKLKGRLYPYQIGYGFKTSGDIKSCHHRLQLQGKMEQVLP